jgi:uncharacterized protein GlcG (DUF336 family)
MTSYATVKRVSRPAAQAGVAAAIGVAQALGIATVVPTHEWWDRLKDGQLVREGLGKQARFLALGGALPITAEDTVIGGIGASAGAAEQDREVAETGLAAIAGLAAPRTQG